MWLYNGEYPVVERPDVENLALAFIQAYFQYTSQGYNNTTANMENSLQYVLFEEPEGEYYVGHSPNYVKVYVRGEALHNQICQVRIGALYKDGVLGQLI